MIQTSTAEFRTHLDDFLIKVRAGETLEVCEHDMPFATILPAQAGARNRTKLGCGRQSVAVKGDLTEPAMEAKDWEMLGANSEGSA